MHRQVVKLKAEGLYFNVSTLLLFQRLLKEQTKEKDLVKFINYVLRQFFKAMEERPFLAVEAFFPRTKGNWKEFSSWEEPQKKTKTKKKDTPGDSSSSDDEVWDAKGGKKSSQKKHGGLELHVKDEYSFTEKVAIAVKALSQKSEYWEEWVKRVCIDYFLCLCIIYWY